MKYFNNEFVKCEKKFSVFFPGKSLQGLHTANINAQFGFMAEILFQVAFAKVRKDVTSGTNTSKWQNTDWCCIEQFNVNVNVQNSSCKCEEKIKKMGKKAKQSWRFWMFLCRHVSGRNIWVSFIISVMKGYRVNLRTVNDAWSQNDCWGCCQIFDLCPV